MEINSGAHKQINLRIVSLFNRGKQPPLESPVLTPFFRNGDSGVQENFGPLLIWRRLKKGIAQRPLNALLRGGRGGSIADREANAGARKKLSTTIIFLLDGIEQTLLKSSIAGMIGRKPNAVLKEVLHAFSLDARLKQSLAQSILKPTIRGSTMRSVIKKADSGTPERLLHRRVILKNSVGQSFQNHAVPWSAGRNIQAEILI